MDKAAPAWKRNVAELIGTFCLVFAGTGAAIVDQQSTGVVTHVGVALTFGLIVMTMIYTIGDVSGAHINPAVTLGFWVARRFPGRQVVPYILSQLCGAILASATLWLLFPNLTSYGETIPANSVAQSLGLEIILTAMLMFIILGVSTGSKEKGVLAGVAIGGFVALAAMFGGPISGASMNPARSLGPALVAGQLSFFWIYVVGPCLGAVIAVGGCRCVQDEGCCSAAGECS